MINRRPTPFITSREILQIIADAHRNYNAESSAEDFTDFLRVHIFARLGDVFVEMYFYNERQKSFTPHASQLSAPESTRCVPPLLPAQAPAVAGIFARPEVLVVRNDQDTPPFLLATGNQSHALFPLSENPKGSALLYIGCRENLPFPEEYLQGIQTVTLLIDSWLKSKDLVCHLKSSMASLEYSEQLRKALYEISEQAHLFTREEDLFSSLHKIVGRFINARNFFIALRNEQDGEQIISFTYYFDELDAHFQGMKIKVDPQQKPSMTSFLMQSGEPILLGPDNFDQFCEENGIKYLGSKAHSLIGVPFYLDNLAGVVLVQSYRDIVYTEKDKDLLVYVARHIGDALEKKKTIDAMRNVNEIFALFMHYSPGYIIIKEVTESHNRVLQTSENYQQITGIPSAKMIGMSMTDLFSADFAARVMADDWKVVSEGIPLQLEQQWNGRTYTTVKFLISQEDKTLLAAFSIDITERKKMEEALRESERRYRIIFEKSPLGIVCLNAEGTVWDCNDKFTEIMGSTRDKILGFNARHQSSPIVRETLGKAMLGQIVSCEEIYTSVTGRKKRHLRGIFSPVVPGHPRSGVIATIEDITEQKKHEKEQQKIEKLESLGVLAGGIAHDFNNILTGIMANISFAKVLLEPEHKISTHLAEAEKASRRAGELARQLLTFARGGEPQKKIISAHDIIPEAVSLMLRGSNVRAFVDIADNIDAVKADEGQISQVLNNIIINSSQAMPGGGALNIIAKNKFIDDSNSYNLTPGTYIKITIRDEGCGISQENRGKIFDPYFTTKPKGTGLGLASAYSIIARHNGHIAVDSVLDKGTSFTIYLPSVGKTYSEHQVPTEQNMSRHQGGTILVMDDEQMIREVAWSMLTHLGYTVTTCSTGEEAIELYKESMNTQRPFSAVIMDLTIPGGIGGIEAAKHILAEAPSANLIVSSGYSNDPVMANHQDYGFIAAIAKPYSLHQFEQVLNILPVQQ
ncbi:PAS domain S-box protein [Desulfopila sp. IMCC35006]|uniref:hybrid sensor histidine kinase/response regulator n=1 Tax=Desulfopila sp. IMCC35006 TaxID=2569542 RepID=UPI0010AC4104|nr:PAS domain S-box protein [Desulfopila sp. IMCC35006]TKB25610.1 PAS domain S-box protein [Desulfopila sp. IMCC35006]